MKNYYGLGYGVYWLLTFQQYDEEKYQALVDMTCFHKLSYKLNEDNIKRKGTYYSILINQWKYQL